MGLTRRRASVIRDRIPPLGGKCNKRIKVDAWVNKKGTNGYTVCKAVWDRKTHVALELPQHVKSGLTYKEAHALKRQIIAGYFG